MLVSAFGTATTFGSWGFFIVRHAFDVIYGTNHWIHCRSVEQLRDGWKSRDGRPVLVTSDIPEGGLAGLLTTAGFPCLAFVDDADEAIAITAQLQNISIPESIRFTTQSFSALENVLRAESVRVFRSDYFARPVTEIIGDILTAMRAPRDDSNVSEILARAHPGVSPELPLTLGDSMFKFLGRPLPPRHALHFLTPEEQRLVRVIAESYRPILEGREIRFVEWPRELFHGDNEIRSGAREVAMMGSARYLIWGPYCFVPAGRWRIKAEIEVTDNHSGNEIYVDISVEQGSIIVAKGRTALPPVGLFGFSLDFHTGKKLSPIEFRIFMMKGGIEGKFAFRSIGLQRVVDVEEKDASVAALAFDKRRTLAVAQSSGP